MSILDQVGAAPVLDDSREYVHEDDLFSTEYPGLYEFLARCKINGKSRKVGKMLIYYEAGRCQIMLSDKHTRSMLWHSDVSVNAALEALERRLQLGTRDWRYDKRART